MKLSFSTLGCPGWSLADILDAAGRLGYDGVELRFVGGDDALWARPELSGAGLRETLARLRDTALAISCVDTRSFFHAPPGAERDRALDEARRSIGLAARLGAPGIRVFGDRVQPGQDLESTRALVAEALQQLGEEAGRSGVEVWLESHGDFARASDVLSILAQVSSEAVGALWDPANAFEVGESPADGHRLLGARVRHVHLKDVARSSGETASSGARPWTPVLPGRGEFGPERVLSVLQAAAYDRWVSFEWEKKWHPAIEEPEVALPHFVAWAAGEMRRAGGLGVPAEGSGHARTLVSGRLKVAVHSSRADLGRAAAALVGARLRDRVAQQGEAAAIFASAPSQEEFLAALRADPQVPWERITAFHLDEYAGLSARHPSSFQRFLRERLFDHVPVRAFHGLDGETADPETECARYAALLRQCRPALVVLGIGENGHLAFIDPPECDFREPRAVRVVALDERCRAQQVHDGAFAHVEDVPGAALSLTIPFLMDIAEAVAIVPGPAKRDAVRAALEGPLSCACPASILRRHPWATLFLDQESAGKLSL
jgi:glucosamine-6-phosphate deaminase